MQKITGAESLRTAILLLEQRQIEEEKLIREQFSVTYASLKPVNILRKVFKDMTAPSHLRDDVVQTITALVTGYISRKMVVRSSRNPILRLGGMFVQYTVTKFVTKNAETIENLGVYYIKKLFGNYGDSKN